MAFAKYAFHSSSIIRQFVRLKDFLIGYFFIIIFFHFFVNIPIHSSVLGWKTGVCFQYSIFWGLVFTHLTCFPHLVCDFSQGRLVSHHRFKVNTLLTQFLTLTGGCHSHSQVCLPLSNCQESGKPRHTTSAEYEWQKDSSSNISQSLVRYKRTWFLDVLNRKK